MKTTVGVATPYYPAKRERYRDLPAGILTEAAYKYSTEYNYSGVWTLNWNAGCGYPRRDIPRV